MLFVMVLLMAGILWSAIFSIKARDNLYSTAEENLDATATAVLIEITRAMHESAEKKAEISGEIVQGLSSVKGIEDITVLNAQGREAFNRESPVIEGSVLQKMSGKIAPFSFRSKKSLVFYKPLENTSYCKNCHVQEGALLGAVKVVASLEEIYGKSMSFIIWSTVVSIGGISLGTIIFWIILRKLVILPLRDIEKSAKSMSEGNLTSYVQIRTEDEIGRLGEAINNSIHSLCNILQRVKNSSIRFFDVTKKVEVEFKKISENIKLESESIGDMATSLEQMNSASEEISSNTDSLASLMEEKSASLEEMVTSVGQVANNARELSTTVDATSASIEELTATIKEVADKTEELIAASEETLTAAEEITSSIKEVEQSAKESAALSEKVNNDASTFGMTSVEKTIEGIQNIKSSFEKTSNFVNRLGARSEEIGKILNVIDEITDQTTLLALNAAILAAQAGEHGKGFSVVAEEIKDLAERTSFSTREIADLIQSVQKEVKDTIIAMDAGLVSVKEGLKVAEDSGNALRKIVESSAQSADMSRSIERSTTEQAKTTKLVTQAMERVKNMVSQVVRATAEQNKGAHLIMTSTEKMRDVASQVRSATNEQLINIKNISQSIEYVSEKARQIAQAVNEQKAGAKQIFRSIEKIKEIPKTNINIIFETGLTLKGLHKNSEILSREMEKFILYEDQPSLATDIGTLYFGIEPVGISPVQAAEKFAPLAEYLSKRLNKKIELKIASDREGVLRDIGKGMIHFCFLSPVSYIEANHSYGVDVLVKSVVEGKSTYHSMIISRTDSSINTISDLKGRSFAFGDPHSLSSYIAPRIMLLDAGVDSKDLQFYEYLGPHEEILNAVLEDKFDAGGVTESIVHKYKSKDIKIIKSSEELPGFCICITKAFSENYRTPLRTALTALTDKSPEGATVLRSIYEKYTAFEKATDADYAVAKAMMSRLGLI